MSYSPKMATREEIRDDYKIRGPVILGYIINYYRNLIKVNIKPEADLRVVNIITVIGT